MPLLDSSRFPLSALAFCRRSFLPVVFLAGCPMLFLTKGSKRCERTIKRDFVMQKHSLHLGHIWHNCICDAFSPASAGLSIHIWRATASQTWQPRARRDPAPSRFCGGSLTFRLPLRQYARLRYCRSVPVILDRSSQFHCLL